METLGIISLVVIVIALVIFALLYATQKVWLSALILSATEAEAFFDQIPEGFVTAYESGGGFMALACSYKGFGPVKAPGDLDWAIRRIGEKDVWRAYTDERGIEHPEEEHTYTKDDFHWDRRLPFVRKLFGKETGIVWMGVWPTVQPRYFNLRISNFRTVKPNTQEIKQKDAELRAYEVNGKAAGWLISWNELTKRALLPDDNYPIPVDGLRLGIRNAKDGTKKQAVVANILVTIRGRIRDPYLFFYRVEDALETIQNEMIQHIRELCSGMTIEEIYEMKVTLESDKADQVNQILRMNDFGRYIRERYGFSIKGAGFSFIEIPGSAGEALYAPFIAQQEADAEAIRGDGQGRAERAKLIQVAAGFKEACAEIGVENVLALRQADVTTSFAESGKSNTVVLGLDSVLGAVKAAASMLPTPKPTEEEKK